MADNRRVDIRKILADPDLRRKLMVSTIQATQAREGIETTREQADRAYYVVTEGERAAFFDLAKYRGGKGEPDRKHEMFVRAIKDGKDSLRFDVARRDFFSIKGAPLAYDRIGHIGWLFTDLLPLDHHASIERGIFTADDSRFVRHYWEIFSDNIISQRNELTNKKCWARFSKGGEFCRFYSDFSLVVNASNNFFDIKESALLKYPYLKGNTDWVLHPENHYFEFGLTWPRRTQRGFNVRILPKGYVFGEKGPSIFTNRGEDIWAFLGILNSRLIEFMLQALMCFGSFETGAVKRIPVPKIEETSVKGLR